jgi:hypothetical protein
MSESGPSIQTSPHDLVGNDRMQEEFLTPVMNNNNTTTMLIVTTTAACFDWRNLAYMVDDAGSCGRHKSYHQMKK